MADSSEREIPTYSGLFIEPLEPVRDDIRVIDIAHALAMQCQFGGHTAYHWSAAAHALLVVRILEEILERTDRDALLWGLLLDAPRAYMGAVPRPLRRGEKFEVYGEVERKLMNAITAKCDLAVVAPDDVSRAVAIACRAEVVRLLHSAKAWVEQADEYDIDREQVAKAMTWIERRTPEQVKQEFIDTFLRLF